MITSDVTCVVCHGPIESKLASRNAKFCSSRCRKAQRFGEFISRNKRGDGWVNGIGSAKVGAIHEMMACAELLKRDISVFRAISPSETCDLLAMKDGKMIRVEVTTAYRSATGKITHSKGGKTDRFDLLVLVERDGTITFEPSISAAFSAVNPISGSAKLTHE